MKCPLARNARKDANVLSGMCSAVARYQILGGHTVNRGVGTGGAELHKSQNIGWARARVPTLQIRPCGVKLTQTLTK